MSPRPEYAWIVEELFDGEVVELLNTHETAAAAIAFALTVAPTRPPLHSCAVALRREAWPRGRATRGYAYPKRGELPKTFSDETSVPEIYRDEFRAAIGATVREIKEPAR
jgi:hypothetical protein